MQTGQISFEEGFLLRERMELALQLKFVKGHCPQEWEPRLIWKQMASESGQSRAVCWSTSLAPSPRLHFLPQQ
jgi:hypothetical protein